MFAKNVGAADRVIRIALGIALLAAWYFLPGFGLRWILPVLAAVAILTAVLSTCPLYSLLGVNTCPMKRG